MGGGDHRLTSHDDSSSEDHECLQKSLCRSIVCVSQRRCWLAGYPGGEVSNHLSYYEFSRRISIFRRINPLGMMNILEISRLKEHFHFNIFAFSTYSHCFLLLLSKSTLTLTNWTGGGKVCRRVSIFGDQLYNKEVSINKEALPPLAIRPLRFPYCFKSLTPKLHRLEYQPGILKQFFSFCRSKTNRRLWSRDWVFEQWHFSTK